MKKLIFALSLIVIMGCTDSKNKSAQLTDYIPNNASLVLKIDDLESFKSDLKNSDFVSKLLKTPRFKTLKDQLEWMDQLKTTESVLLCFNTLSDSLEFSLVARFNDSLFGNTPIDSLNLKSKQFDRIIIVSNSNEISSSRQTYQKGDFKSFDLSSDSDRSFSMLFQTMNSNSLEHLFLLGDSVGSFSNLFLNSEINPDQIKFNGIVFSKDSLNDLSTIFYKNIPQENSIQQLAPSDAEGLLSITFNDFKALNQQLNYYRATSQDSTLHSSLFETISEIGEVYFDNDQVVVMRTIDASTTNDALINHQELDFSFRDVDILKFSEAELFYSTFNPFVSKTDITKYFKIDDFFVFGNSDEILKKIISSYKNGATLTSNNAFLDCMTNLSDESSILMVANSNRLNQMVSKLSGDDFENVDVTDYKMSAFQLIKDDGFSHLNGIIKKSKTRGQLHSITEEFSVTLDADILMAPQFVTNYRTYEKDIVVQDINNVIYLISNNGKVLWKKQLQGNILGDVQQIDIYKNGRLQMAFATPNRLYVLDRNGNEVSPFPLKFNDEITQPLSIFDYDNNKNYRFFITQGKDLLLYDKAGRAVIGFSYSGNEIVKTAPKHFRVGSKDFIAFTAADKMQILNRKGQTRINVSDRYNFSYNPIFLYNNAFTTTTDNGELIQIDLNGRLKKTPLNLLKDHRLDATSKTLVTLSENRLSIKDRALELDFGNFTTPKIFYINDKIYVSVTDMQSHQIFLFDSQANPLENFPVYGNSAIDLSNIDSDNYLEFVSIGEPNSIIVYQKN